MKKKSKIILLIYIIAGIILGGLIAALTKDISGLSWLSYGKTFGIGSPGNWLIHFSVVKIAFAMDLEVNVAIIIMTLLSLILYKRYE